MTDQHGTTGVVLIADVVASKRHADRAALQARLAAAIERANADERVVQPLYPVLGDELQGAVTRLGDGLRLALELRLGLLPEVDLRTGLGVGRYEVFDPSSSPASQDGPAWWAARRAVDEAKEQAARPATRHVRARVCALDADGRAPSDGDTVAAINGFLGLQDYLLAAMSDRHRRLLAAALAGEHQRDVAQREGITQSAVSQGLQTSGAQALVHALVAVDAVTAPETPTPQESAQR